MAEVNIPRLAASYRQVVLWFGFQLLLGLGSPFYFGLLPPEWRGLPMLATLIPLAYYAYATAKAFGSSSAGLWAFAMFVPCANVITLLALSSKATALCRANGVEVGLLGPRV
jgi:hypothetical protein